MFKISLITFMSICFVSQGFAQNKITEINVGLLGPSEADGGFFGGVNVGRMVDEKIGISLGLHIYRSSYSKREKVSGQSFATLLEQSSTLIPMYFQLHYVGPITEVLDLKITGGLGYELFWNSYQNFEEGVDDTDFFSGFGWILAAGVSLPISTAADFYGEVLYHGSAPSKDAGETVEGYPVRTEVYMSGLGLRIGIRLYNFGL